MDPQETVIDCDLHNVVPGVEALFPYLPEHWREYIGQSGFKGATPRPPRSSPAAT